MSLVKIDSRTFYLLSKIWFCCVSPTPVWPHFSPSSFWWDSYTLVRHPRGQVTSLTHTPWLIYRLTDGHRSIAIAHRTSRAKNVPLSNNSPPNFSPICSPEKYACHLIENWVILLCPNLVSWSSALSVPQNGRVKRGWYKWVKSAELNKNTVMSQKEKETDL